ncbi:Starch-binding associating with outer membrane [Algoriella xinjiangensis]|uniref:Starch-binding associating with outer membrane n=1 Tax=Algoriella xinjiangensis TaxID=684065 RepID=A0A1I4TCJ7_9FLAO|nr:SusD/RagB family nutrient-binding outer membrane lipoprotein [Algoriella xinjiangensis]SFM74343.1 Starch-binding associating with outer membrane [Algoriella xinjiangensis]VDH15014.1 Susd and RagB outer membrane lipoprotein [Algoriella xinjiangensis]
MKKIILTLASILVIQSCSDEYYDSLSIDPINPSEVPANYFFTNAITTYYTQMLNTNVNTNVFRLWSQQWNETQYTDETNYNLETRNINGRLWTSLNTNVIFDLQSAKELIAKDGLLTADVKKNQTAIADIIQVQAWLVMVDTFGNVPYTEALKGGGNITPKYDDAKSIYEDLIKRLQEDVANINVAAAGFGSTNDIVYKGDMSKWKKLAASLLLKMGVQVADADNALAQKTIQAALSSGVMTSKADNFTLVYPGSEPYVNPLWIDLVQGGRKDFVAANTIVDKMNTLTDPRRKIYFRENLGADEFKGGTYGIATPYDQYSQVGDLLHKKDYPGNLLDITEVKFLLAEAAERGFSVGGSAADFYNEGIKASFDFWGLTTAQADAYLAQSNVAYATAPGTWKEKIGMQYYLAMYNKGFDAWTVIRRLDAPKMNIAAELGLPFPSRFTYPTSERNLNKVNNTQAVNDMGGKDELTLKLFWDKF